MKPKIENREVQEFDLNWNSGITDESAPYLIDMIKKSGLVEMDISQTSISAQKEQEINKALNIPVDRREVPIKSKTKSAAKIQSASIT